MGHPQGQGPLRHTRVAEAPDTGTVTGEATITGPQIIRQSLISFRVDQPVPVIQMFKEIIEIKGIKEGNILILTYLDFCARRSSGREEVYSLMGYSMISSKALIFYKKCQFCCSSGKVAWMNKKFQQIC